MFNTKEHVSRAISEDLHLRGRRGARRAHIRGYMQCGVVLPIPCVRRSACPQKCPQYLHAVGPARVHVVAVRGRPRRVVQRRLLRGIVGLGNQG